MERQEIIDLKLIRDKYFKNHPSYQKAINMGIDAIQQIQKDEDCIAKNKELEEKCKKSRLPEGDDYIFGKEAILQNDIKILETFRYRQKTKNYNKITLEDVQAIENLIAKNKELESDKQQLKFENNLLKQDIKNMYHQEAIISILEEEFNLNREESIEILENY